ncbi:MAG: hypothetical protein WA549_01880 [Thermoplasmata archaeon]
MAGDVTPPNTQEAIPAPVKTLRISGPQTIIAKSITIGSTYGPYIPNVDNRFFPAMDSLVCHTLYIDTPSSNPVTINIGSPGGTVFPLASGVATSHKFDNVDITQFAFNGGVSGIINVIAEGTFITPVFGPNGSISNSD